MTDVDITGILDRIVSHAMASGQFERVNQHEPKSAPGNGLHCAVWAQRIGPDRRGSGLASTSAHLIFNIRIYMSMVSEPQDAIDPAVMAAVDALMAAYAGDFTLGGLVRNVDIRGIDGIPMTAEAGYLNQDNKIYRVMTITLPVLVNDAWAEAA